MILMDFNQVCISNLMQYLYQTKEKVETGLVKHMVLNSIRSHNRKFRAQYGELVICCDNRNYWRKDVFPHYKAGRKDMREKSDFDWNLIYGAIEEMKSEIREHFPYKVLDVDRAEADDIIGVLTMEFHNKEPILILSADKDFLQLQRFSGVDQYSPMADEFIKTADPVRFLQEQIIRGDAGDGIPNILSPADSFVTGTRQKPVYAKKIPEWLEGGIESMEPSMQERYLDNERLIDLSKVPQDVRNKIMDAFRAERPKTSQTDIMTYLANQKMRQMISLVGDFKVTPYKQVFDFE
jgi:hypothetical protein